MAATGLDRFVLAQDEGASFLRAMTELRAGQKRSHWIWWVFPQVEGLGRSANSRYYAIRSLDEARAYWRHPVLGARLRQAVEAMLRASPSDAGAVLGADDVKFRSSMTLFHHAEPDEPIFRSALERFFAASCDPLTHELIGQGDE